MLASILYDYGRFSVEVKSTLLLGAYDESLDEAKYIQLRRKQAEKYNLSDKTVRRYVNAYRQNGFEGLKPRARHYYQKGNLPDNYEELVHEAIQLRREVPSRSVEKIILILEMEKRVAPGVLKRSTLQRHLYEAGFGAGQMEVYREARKKLFQTLLEATPHDACPGRHQGRNLPSDR